MAKRRWQVMVYNLLLVSVGIDHLMVLLLRSLEQHNLSEAETQLQKHATMLATIFEEQGNDPENRDMIDRYGENFASNIAIFEGRRKDLELRKLSTF